MGRRISELHREWMQEPEYKAEYEALEGEYSVVREMIRARSQAGLTQAEVAEKMGTKQSAVSQIESGGNISLGRLRAYADAVGASLDIRLRVGG